MSVTDSRDGKVSPSSGQARRDFLKVAALTAAGTSSAALFGGLKPSDATIASNESGTHCATVNTPMKDVEGKVAFITGGSSGVGLGIARAFSDAGMKVVITYRTREHLDEAMRLLEPAASRIHAINLDVTDRSGMEEAASDAERAFGKVHVLVNNAGVMAAASLAETSYDDWDWTIGVNLNGVFNGVHTFLPRIRSHGEGGQIITIASIAGLFVGREGAYAVSKFAVVAMMEALRSDLSETNIGVSVCCPGLISSKIMDSERNRPETLGSSGAQFDPQTRARIKRDMDNPKLAMDPLEAGRLMLRGMRRNDLYIFTHPEWAPYLRVRYEALMASIPADVQPSAKQIADATSSIRQSIYRKELDRKLCGRREYPNRFG